MNSLRIVVFSLLVIGLAIVLVSAFSIRPEKDNIDDYRFGCTPDFWKNNLELWEVLGVDYNDDFDETFGTDYFEPNITLKQAINAEGPGWAHLASYGTAAYLVSIVNPYADVEILKETVHDNNLHAIDAFISLCIENMN